MGNRDPDNTNRNNNPYMREALTDVLDVVGGPDAWDVYPLFIYGDHFADVGGTQALSRVERKAAKLAPK